MSNLINLDGVEKRLRFLAETDVEFGTMRAELDNMKEKIKTVEATVFLTVEGTVEKRKAITRQHSSVQELLDEQFEMNTQYQVLSARRSTAVMYIEAWRSVNAARNKGSV